MQALGYLREPVMDWIERLKLFRLCLPWRCDEDILDEVIELFCSTKKSGGSVLTSFRNYWKVLLASSRETGMVLAWAAVLN